MRMIWTDGENVNMEGKMHTVWEKGQDLAEGCLGWDGNGE